MNLNTDIHEQEIPEEIDPEYFKYIPESSQYVLKNSINRNDVADIAPISAATNGTMEFQIKPDQNYLIDIDKTKFFVDFDIELVTEAGVAQAIGTTVAAADNNAAGTKDKGDIAFADGWCYSFLQSIKLHFFNQQVEECRYPFYKAALNTAMKFSKSDYERGMYASMGYGTTYDDSIFTHNATTIGTHLVFRASDILETCKSIKSMPYQVFMKYTFQMLSSNKKLAIEPLKKTTAGTGGNPDTVETYYWRVKENTLKIRLTVPSKVPSVPLEKAVLESYSGVPQLNYELLSENTLTQSTSRYHNHVLSQSTFIKNKVLMLMFFKETVNATRPFENYSTPDSLQRIEVSNQGTVKYYEKTMDAGNYLELYQDYLDCKEYFSSIDECAVTYNEYVTRYFTICIPLEDFEMPKKDSNIVVKLWYSSDTTNTKMYSVFLGEALAKIDVRKNHFVASNN